MHQPATVGLVPPALRDRVAAFFNRVRTASETRELAKELNAAARKQREAEDRAHEARMAEIKRTTAEWKKGLVPPAARLDTAAIYAARNQARDQAPPARPSDTAGPTPATLNQLAREIYSASSPDVGEFVPSSARGGAA